MRSVFASLFITVAVATGQPAFAKESTKINRPENVELISSVGDAMLRVHMRESLPNAFGGADVFGRKRDRGYVFLSYYGLRDGRAVIRRRTVDIMSTESTMSRGGLGTFSANATTFGNTTTVTGTTTRAPQATVTALPADTIELFVDADRGGIITVEDRVIEIAGADANVVRFKIRTNPKAR